MLGVLHFFTRQMLENLFLDQKPLEKKQLTRCCHDNVCLRVQAHAAAALINFSEPCDSSVMLPYLEGLLQQLGELLRSSQRNIQEQAITAIAGIADNVKDGFTKVSFLNLSKTITKDSLSNLNIRNSFVLYLIQS